MKVLIAMTEWCPCYVLADDVGFCKDADIGEKELAWMQSVFEQFDQVQERLRELYKEGA